MVKHNEGPKCIYLAGLNLAHLEIFLRQRCFSPAGSLPITAVQHTKLCFTKCRIHYQLLFTLLEISLTSDLYKTSAQIQSFTSQR